MRLMDTHCHLDFNAFDGHRDRLVSECANAGIQRIMVPGVCRENWSKCLSLSEYYSGVDAALGLHPYFVDQHTREDLEQLDLLLRDQSLGIQAVGETGLDDTRPSFERQCEFFEAHLDLAEKHSLPVIMHMRRNHGHGLKRVKKANLVGGVIHAFAGSYQDAMSWIELGVSIGVGGIITYERARKTRNTIARLPLTSLVLETDSPDMAIQGELKGEGSPLMVGRVFSALCDLRKESPQELERALWDNSCSLFNIA